MAMIEINDLDQWQHFCRRLNEKTQSSEIEWEDWSHRIGRPNSRSPLFVTLHKEWRILIYRHAYKYFQDDELFEWEETTKMELIDDEGKTLWVVPKVPAMHTLLDYVQFQGANVEQLLSDILGNEPT